MPLIGYHIEEDNVSIQESQKYFEEYEDNIDLIMRVKNFREGYWDSMDTIKTRVYMLKNDEEFYKTARNAYKQFVVK